MIDDKARARLAELGTTPLASAELARILDAATGAKHDGDSLVISFPAGPDWEISFAGKRIKSMNYGDTGTLGSVSFHDGKDGTMHALGGDDCGLDEDRDGFAYAKSLIAPVDVGFSVYYVFHPKTKALHRFDMDGGLDAEPIAGGPAEAFLVEMAGALSSELDDFPAKPPARTAWDCPTNARKWKLAGSFRAAAARGRMLATLRSENGPKTTLQLWDVSRAADVAELGSVVLAERSAPCPQIALAAKRALVLRGTLVEEIDLAKPKKPRIAGHFTDKSLPDISFGVSVLAVTDEHVYALHQRKDTCELTVDDVVVEALKDLMFLAVTGRTLVAGSRKKMWAWDLADPLAPKKRGSVAFSADIDVTATPVGDDHVVITSYSGAILVDLAAMEAHKLTIDDQPRAACAGRDSVFLTTSTDDELLIWRFSLTDGKPRGRATLLEKDGAVVRKAIWAGAAGDELLVALEHGRFAAFRLSALFE